MESEFIPFDQGDTACVPGDTLNITWTTYAVNQFKEVLGKSVVTIIHHVTKTGVATGIDNEGIVIWKPGHEGDSIMERKVVDIPLSPELIEEYWRQQEQEEEQECWDGLVPLC